MSPATTTPPYLKTQPTTLMRPIVGALACCGLNSCAAFLPSTYSAALAVLTAKLSACCLAHDPQTHSTISSGPSANLRLRRLAHKLDRRRKLICADQLPQRWLARALPRFCRTANISTLPHMCCTLTTGELTPLPAIQGITAKIHSRRTGFWRLQVLDFRA